MNWYRIWANRLVEGSQLWRDVPQKRRQGVTDELASRVARGDISQARMDEIIHS